MCVGWHSDGHVDGTREYRLFRVASTSARNDTESTTRESRQHRHGAWTFLLRRYAGQLLCWISVLCVHRPKADDDGAPMSERSGTSVPRRSLRPTVQAEKFPFRWAKSTARTTSPTQHVWPPGFYRCWSVRLEQFPRYLSATRMPPKLLAGTCWIQFCSIRYQCTARSILWDVQLCT